MGQGEPQFTRVQAKFASSWTRAFLDPLGVIFLNDLLPRVSPMRLNPWLKSPTRFEVEQPAAQIS
jgi:hypothetical protein